MFSHLQSSIVTILRTAEASPHLPEMDRGRQQLQLPELSGLLWIGRPGGTSGCATTGGATPGRNGWEKWMESIEIYGQSMNTG